MLGLFSKCVCVHLVLFVTIFLTRGPFLESPEPFRAHFGWHNSLCIFKAKASRDTKLCSYLYFYSLYNIWKDQLYRISGSQFYERLYEPEKFSGLSRNGPQVHFPNFRDFLAFSLRMRMTLFRPIVQRSIICNMQLRLPTYRSGGTTFLRYITSYQILNYKILWNVFLTEYNAVVQRNKHKTFHSHYLVRRTCKRPSDAVCSSFLENLTFAENGKRSLNNG